MFVVATMRLLKWGTLIWAIGDIPVVWHDAPVFAWLRAAAQQ
jgi:hypothetical protein